MADMKSDFKIGIECKYTVVESPHLDKLISDVNSAIEQGFTPLGGMIVYDCGFGLCFSQTMVKVDGII